MVRINVDLTDEMHNRAERAATARGLSLDEFVRQCVATNVAYEVSGSIYDNFEVYEGPAPSDLSARHDDYLYGDAP